MLKTTKRSRARWGITLCSRHICCCGIVVTCTLLASIVFLLIVGLEPPHNNGRTSRRSLVPFSDSVQSSSNLISGTNPSVPLGNVVPVGTSPTAPSNSVAQPTVDLSQERKSPFSALSRRGVNVLVLDSSRHRKVTPSDSQDLVTCSREISNLDQTFSGWRDLVGISAPPSAAWQPADAASITPLTKGLHQVMESFKRRASFESILQQKLSFLRERSSPSSPHARRLLSVVSAMASAGRNFGGVEPVAGLRKPVASSPRCESLFGTAGFHAMPDLCRQGASSVKCFFNRVLGASTCLLERVLVDPAHVRVASGGERIQSVLGREEQVEFPTYADGAISLSCEQQLPRPDIRAPHHVGSILRSLQFRAEGHPCDPDAQNRDIDWIEEATMLVTRYEYANLYHQMTELFAAFQSEQVARVAGLIGDAPLRLLVADGHAQGAMDQLWQAWPPLRQASGAALPFVSRLRRPACFRRLLVAYAGYDSPLAVTHMELLSDHTQGCTGSAQVEAFGQRLWTSFKMHTLHPPRFG